jgi:hypothetical protein
MGAIKQLAWAQPNAYYQHAQSKSGVMATCLMLNLLWNAGEFSLLLLKAADEKSAPSCGIFIICILAFAKLLHHLQGRLAIFTPQNSVYSYSL